MPAFRLAADENAPPLELLPSASKQRKTEREERKQKGKARGLTKRPFGLDLKQHPRKEHEASSESDEEKLEEQLAATRKQRQKETGGSVDGRTKGGEAQAGRRGWVAARRKSLLQNKLKADGNSPELVKRQKDKDGWGNPGGEEPEEEKSSPRKGDGDVPEALAAEPARRARKQAAGINGLFWTGSSLQQGGPETGRPMQSSEGTMMDGGSDMEIDESDEEVEGPLKGVEEVAGSVRGKLRIVL